jgi:hypothetical protein
MQPVIVIVCHHCRKLGHYAFACPDNPENRATPEQQQYVLEAMQEAMRPPSAWWLVAAAALIGVMIALM